MPKPSKAKQLINDLRSQGFSHERILDTLDRMRDQNSISSRVFQEAKAWVLGEKAIEASLSKKASPVSEVAELLNLAQNSTTVPFTPMKALPEKGVGGYASQTERTARILSKLQGPTGGGGEPIPIPLTKAEQAGRDFLDQIARATIRQPKLLPPAPEVSGSTVDFGMNWNPRPPQDPAPFMPGLDAERVSVPVAEAVAKVARKSRAERGLASMLAASGLEGEGTMLQRGMAKLLQKLGAEGTVVAGRRAGMLGKAAQVGLGAAIKHPVMSGLNALTMIPLALSAGKGIVNGLSEAVTGEDAIGNTSFDTVQRLEEEARRADLRRQMVQENRARVLAQNTMSLMQNAPDVAAQILAGRRLPRGGVVIGGTPRVDLMQEMAGQMADGSFRRPDPLAELTGG